MSNSILSQCSIIILAEPSSNLEFVYNPQYKRMLMISALFGLYFYYFPSTFEYQMTPLSFAMGTSERYQQDTSLLSSDNHDM